MYRTFQFTQISGLAAIKAVSQTLRRIDERLVDHGERVAFIATELLREGELKLDSRLLFILAIFHDVGAYKTDEIDKMMEFETNEVLNHSVYGYLFLKYMTPLKESSLAILHHHTKWEQLVNEDNNYKDYAALIHLADRIDILRQSNSFDKEFGRLINDKGVNFKPEYLDLFLKSYKKLQLFEKIDCDYYKRSNEKLIDKFNFSVSEAIEFLEMIVYSIDFRSEFTVVHSINTISIAISISNHFCLKKECMEKIYLGALLHDVGKISIPTTILEYPGRLDENMMKIMKGHVKETENLIRGIVPDEICNIASRHHEKLDGSGYPKGLTGKDLTLPERIVAVADIVSALCSRRSYKEPFPKEKIINILKEMSESQLDKNVCEYVCDNYDKIMEETEPNRDYIIEKYTLIKEEYTKCE